MDQEPDNQEITSEIKSQRDGLGRLLPGNTANPSGRPIETLEQKVLKKELKVVIEDYRDMLAEALPILSSVLIEKAQSGDMRAIKEINDRVMGKASQQTELNVKSGLDLVSLFDKVNELEDEEKRIKELENDSRIEKGGGLN